MPTCSHDNANYLKDGRKSPLIHRELKRLNKKYKHTRSYIYIVSTNTIIKRKKELYLARWGETRDSISHEHEIILLFYFAVIKASRQLTKKGQCWIKHGDVSSTGVTMNYRVSIYCTQYRRI